MLKPKIYYFFIYGAMAALVPYLVIYYQESGLERQPDRPSHGHPDADVLVQHAGLGRAG